MRIFGTTNGGDIITGVGSVLSGAGDFNGDTFEDIIVGMPDSTVGGLSKCGLVAVIFGRNTNFHDVVFTSFTSSASEGFLIIGAAADAMLGVSVTTLGYFDTDNKKDIAISAGASVNSGQVYVLVLYGRSAVAGTIDLASAIPGTFGGFYITGNNAAPSAAPSIIPSLQPSLVPSYALTAAPTVNPSIQPSVSPTLTPSSAPSKSTAADID
eukprot:gene33919-38334_t